MSNQTQAVRGDNGTEACRRGYVAALVVNAVLLYAAHHLLEWGVPFITPAFDDALWAVTLSLGATLVANALFIAYDAVWFRHVAQVALDGLALLSVYTLYHVFPFAFDAAWLNDCVSIALLFTMIAIATSLTVQVVRALFDLNWWQEEEVKAY